MTILVTTPPILIDHQTDFWGVCRMVVSLYNESTSPFHTDEEAEAYIITRLYDLIDEGMAIYDDTADFMIRRFIQEARAHPGHEHWQQCVANAKQEAKKARERIERDFPPTIPFYREGVSCVDKEIL